MEQAGVEPALSATFVQMGARTPLSRIASLSRQSSITRSLGKDDHNREGTTLAVSSRKQTAPKSSRAQMRFIYIGSASPYAVAHCSSLGL